MKYLLFLFFLMCRGLEVSLGVGKTEDIYLVASNTLLTASVDHKTE